MNFETLEKLKNTALRARKLALLGIFSAQSGHPGGSFSCADILTYLYFEAINVDPDNPKNPDRDRFVLSKGHAAPMLYAILALRGFFREDELKNLRSFGSFLQGHPDMKGTNGVEMSTGSLGQGISAANGMALAGKLGGRPYRVYALLGDGELQEGQVWEAAMFASHYKLDNITWIIDANGLQIDGKIADVMNIEPIAEKFRAFGFNALEIDAHNFEEIDEAVNAAKTCVGRPSVIIARSVKGKGVSFMENNAAWHGTAPNEAQYAAAMSELS
jgi:transketolase